MKLPLQTLRYPTIVVHDAKAIARNYADFFGITTWKVQHLGPDRLQRSTVRGRVPTKPPPTDGLFGDPPVPGAYGFIMATGTSPNGNLTFQLVQPTSGLSTFEEFLVTRGQGVHGIFATVLDRSEFDNLEPWLAEFGVPVAQSFRIGKADYYYLDMRKPLANFFVQVVVPLADDWEAAPDEVWDLSGEVTRPKDVNAAINAIGITHFGVVIDNLQERLPNFARIFGENVWRGMKWRTAPGSLEDTTNNGQPVVHGYFTGRTDLGKNPSGLPFGFEVIQPTFGPSHYKEDFLLALGPGIHHVDVRTPMADWNEWERTNAWLDERFGARTCMSGWLRQRSALFHYKDTRQKLGFVTELSAPKRDNAPAQRWQPDYWYDFSAVAR